MKRQKKGFTLVELLVVIAIIGLLATIAFLSLNRARSKARDAKRVSDIRQFQSGLELYYNDQATPAYPISGAATMSSAILSTVYLADIPTAPIPADKPVTGTDCSDPNATNNDYRYRSLDGQGGTACNSSNTANCGAWYEMSFCLGGATGGLSAGCNVASPTGITAGNCF